MAGILAMILAGGEGSRLFPLTQTRTKPAVPFGGNYRLVDFALNNFVNADLMKIYVLTQFKSQSLNIHLRKAWRLSGIGKANRFIEAIPAQQRVNKNWYSGTADAIYQNARFIEKSAAEHVCIFGSDHIYKMDVQQMVEHHERKGGALTVSAIRIVKEQAYHFGIIEVDDEGRMIGFAEKPAVEDAKTIPGDPDHVLASMGNYIFESKVLLKELYEDAANSTSQHDFGNDIIPKLYPAGNVFVYRLSDNFIPGEPATAYWRDVGTLDSYWEAHMDMLKPEAPFSLYNKNWPLHTYHPPLPPATFRDPEGCETAVAQSLIGAGSYINGAKIENSILGFRSHVCQNVIIKDSIFLGNAKIGAGSRLTKVILDKDIEIAPNTIIGENLEEDRKNFTVSDEGVIAIAKGSRIGF
ncbi:glucose-1-phosphate adenylyltransferase [Psychromonas ingrahamii 37]|uniref:Glucose-1-phosphate adenylyltransferase n=1 Tax=Psychromonas ingrahamii (strain DSM 17664 / CCUG 51855 / 37) TaxID=357804 RepID=A1SZ20_PSYIN|nr:glucose-1-phosphate adenylyltransferase [Psychromonas ingrahamii]ABM04735.1 glucose-1-phosphate adenylyltransferase [Psychromonas ingrahamii 37]